MESLLGDWPSHNPHNFSQLRPSDRSQSLQLSPPPYCGINSRATPPAHQVISTEATNILLRQFYQRAGKEDGLFSTARKHVRSDTKMLEGIYNILRTKRPALDYPTGEHSSKQIKSTSNYGEEYKGDDLSQAGQVNS